MGKSIVISSTILPTLGTVTLINKTVVPITAISILNKPVSVIDSVQLIVSKTPSNTTQTGVIWSSSNTAIAVVSDTGLVSVISEGSVTITATSYSDGNVTDTAVFNCALTSPVVQITGITIQNKPATVIDAVQLSYTLSPSNTTQTDVTWSSSVPMAATVSNTGLVTVTGVGISTISLTSSINSTISDSFSTQCSFTIIPVTSLNISGNNSVTVGGTLQLYGDILPGNATNTSVIWTSSNNSLATVSNTGLVTAIADGSLNITCTSVSDPSIFAVKAITINAVQSVVHKLYFKQSVNVNGVSAWTWTDSKSGVKVNKNYLHVTMPSTIVNSAGATVPGITKMTSAEMQLIDQYAGTSSFIDQTLTGANAADCAYDLTMIKNICTPHTSGANNAKSAMGMHCPNGTYHYKILLGCAASKTTSQALLKINGTTISLPNFNCMDNLNNYVEGDFVVTTGYMMLTLDKQNYSGSNPIGFSLTEIDMTVTS